jgi:hypothetical protein
MVPIIVVGSISFLLLGGTFLVNNLVAAFYMLCIRKYPKKPDVEQ